MFIGFKNKKCRIPKVSVIIPVYNVEKYLRECLDSVVNQTLKDVEIICVNDGSTDNSMAILKEYAARDSRFIVLNQRNKGAGAARNRGLKIASGEYLSFLDADDFFDINLIDKTYNLAKRNYLDIVYYQYTLYNTQTKQKEKIIHISKKNTTENNFLIFETKNLSNELYNIISPAPWNKLIKRELVVSNKIKFQEQSHSNDIYFTLTAATLSSRVGLLYESLVNYRYNKTDSLSNTRDKNPLCFYSAYKAVAKTLKKRHLYEKYYKTFLKAFISSAFWNLGQTSEKKEMLKNFIKKQIIPEFNILEQENLDILPNKQREMVLSITDKTISESSA